MSSTTYTTEQSTTPPKDSVKKNMIKILILECNTIDINFIYNELNRTGLQYNASTINLDQERLNLDVMCKPDIIISGYADLQNTGKVVLQISARWSPSIPVVLITNHIEIHDCVTLIKKGISDIILIENIASLTTRISTILSQSFAEHSSIVSGILRENSNRKSKYSSLIKNSTDAILLAVKDGDILEANPAACELFKMTEDEICLTGRLGLLKNNQNLDALLKERDLNGITTGNLTFKRKDGSFFIAEITSVAFKNSSGSEMTSLIIKDLTQSLKAEEHLAKTAAELQEAVHSINKVLNASMDLIFSIGAEKNIMQINSASKDILGYEAYELLHKNYGDLLHKEDQEAIFKNEEDIRNGKPLKSFEASIIHKNGTTVNILVSAQWDGEDKLIYCTAKDITEKKKLEKAYEVERNRFLDIYNLSPACMAVLKGPSHIHELANPLYLNLVNRNNVIGKTVLEVFPEMEIQGIVVLLDTVFKTGIPFCASEMLIRMDLNNDGLLVDKYMNFMYQAHRNSSGVIDGIFVFAIDVTEQVLSRIQIEQSAKMHHQLISELPVAAYSCDANGKIVFFNKAAATLWGSDPKLGNDSFCGFSQIFNDDGLSIPLQMSPMAVSLKEGRVVSGGATIVQRADGQKRYVVPHVVPYIDSAGRVTGAVNMVTDITESKAAQTALELRNTQLAFQFQENEKKAAELAIANTELAYQNKEKEERAKELILTNSELVKTNNELDRFVYSVSHDLRSPLTSIQGLVSIIEDESKEPETLKHIQMISCSIDRLDEFIRRILSYSQNNRTVLDIEPIQVQKTILSITEGLQNMKQAKGIYFEIESKELSSFFSDKLRFGTIVENLISNAIKYQKTNGKGRYIKVKAIANEEILQLEISDNGIGIPLEHHKKIFDMFYRISSKSEGSGIGLYIVKDTVEKLEGNIEIVSEIKGGTTFKINLKNFKSC